MIDKFWRSSSNEKCPPDIMRHIDLTGCTLLLERDGDVLIGMKDGTVLAIYGHSKLAVVEKSLYGNVVRCPVPLPLNLRPDDGDLFDERAFEIDHAYFKEISVKGRRERFAFVPKVKRWFIDVTTRRYL